MDPSPSIEKDLDDDSEEVIVSWAREFPPNASVKLSVHLEQWPAENLQQLIEQALHNYFAHRAELTDLEFRRLMNRDRTGLVIGLSCLAGFLAISKALLSADNGTWAGILRERRHPRNRFSQAADCRRLRRLSLAASRKTTSRAEVAGSLGGAIALAPDCCRRLACGCHRPQPRCHSARAV